MSQNSLFKINIISLERYFTYKLEWSKWRWRSWCNFIYLSLVFGNDRGRTLSPTQIPESWGLSLCSLMCTAKTPVLSTNIVFPERENANCVIQALSQSYLHKYEACEGLSGVWGSIKLFLSKKVIAFQVLLINKQIFTMCCRVCSLPKTQIYAYNKNPQPLKMFWNYNSWGVLTPLFPFSWGKIQKSVVTAIYLSFIEIVCEKYQTEWQDR